jgi:hypothetical protein
MRSSLAHGVTSICAPRLVIVEDSSVAPNGGDVRA